MSNPDGSDRVCLVTGAARGNGLAIARALTDSGATVYLADIARDLPDVPYALAAPRDFDDAVESLQTIHNRVYGIRFDVRDAKAAARAVTQIETEQGRPLKTPLIVANCVGLVKAVLCIHAPLAQTPYQLYKFLRKSS